MKKPNLVVVIVMKENWRLEEDDAKAAIAISVSEVTHLLPFPWSQHYQEVAALFHIGTTKSHPPIPEHLSAEAKDFLLKCLQKEPNLRASASELLQHPFVTGEHRETHPMFRTSSVENSGGSLPSGTNLKNSIRPVAGPSLTYDDVNTVSDLDSVRCSTMINEKFSLSAQNWGANNSDDDMCHLDDKDFDLGGPVKSALLSDDPNKSFNPMCEPTDDWLCKYDQSPEPDHEYRRIDVDADQPVSNTISPGTSEQEADFTFPCGPSASEEEDEVLTEQKIKAFLEEKAMLLLDAFNKDRAYLQQPLPPPPPLAPLPVLAPPDHRTQEMINEKFKKVEDLGGVKGTRVI